MMGGVQKTTDFLDKSTWTLAAILIVLILFSSLSFTGNLGDTDSKLIDGTQTAAPASTTAAPAPVTPAPTQTAPVDATPAQ